MRYSSTRCLPFRHIPRKASDDLASLGITSWSPMRQSYTLQQDTFLWSNLLIDNLLYDYLLYNNLLYGNLLWDNILWGSLPWDNLL